jgi:thiamine-phosphate pyrophosphorylase
MTDRRERLREARLYLCTGNRPDLPEFLDAVLSGGVDIVQLREKGLEAKQEVQLAEVFMAACRRYGALFSINDRADVAHAVRPDILHLGQDDLPPNTARDILGQEIIIGRSTHAESDIAAVLADPVTDYFCVGPTWPTPTKPGRPAPGLRLITYAAEQQTHLPWFAIGGIDLGNLDDVLDAGARRVVVVRAITEATDPHKAAAAFASRLQARQ